MLRRLTITGALLVFAVLPATAGAQGGTSVGGDVPSFLQLTLTQPVAAFSSFPARNVVHTYSLQIAAQVTATDAPLVMTIDDADAAGSSRHGYLFSGSQSLASPLEVATGTNTWAGLDGTGEPLLGQWAVPVSNAPAAIRLRQQVSPHDHHSGFHKLLLLTVSTQSP
jgi:hypothetical protein